MSSMGVAAIARSEPSTSTDSARTAYGGAGRRRWAAWLSLPLTIAVCGWASVLVGQDLNGDQFAYHVSWLWTLFNPSQDPSWAAGGPSGLVPSLWNVPWYYLALHADPDVAVFYLGAVHGVAIWLAAAVAWTALRGAGPLRLLMTLVVALGSFLSPGVVTEFGTTFGNLTTASFVLAAVLLYLRRPTTDVRAGRILVIGALLGLAIGFKLTNVIWFIAMAAGLFACEPRRLRHLLRVATALAAGTGAGALLTGGYWWWRMWERFDNPVFPFYNGIFNSPYGWTDNWHDDRYLVGPVQALAMPLSMAMGRLPSEGPGRDIRWAVVAELAVLAFLLVRVRRTRTTSATEPVPSSAPQGVALVPQSTKAFLLTFVSVGWVVWLLQFGIERYLIVLELLSILTVVCLIDTVVRLPLWRTAAVALLPVAICALVVVPNWPHEPTGDSWFSFQTPPLARQANLLVVEPNGALLSHALLAMPKGTIAARTADIYAMAGMKNPPRYSSRADDEVRALIKTHDGPVVSLTFMDERQIRRAQRAAESVGMVFDRANCQLMRSKLGRFEVCPWTGAG